MTSFAHQAAQIDLVALAKYLEAAAAGLQGADHGGEDADGAVEPDVPAGLAQRPLRAAQEAAGPAAEERARGRPRVPRHEGAGGHRRAGAAHAAPVRGRQRHRHRLLRHGVRRRHRVLGPGAAGAGQGAAHQGLRRAEPGAGRAALWSTRPRSGSPTSARPGSYFARQRDRWTKQYRASETEHIEDMETLIAWLEKNEPPDDGRASLVHGDYRIDNMIFKPDGSRLLAVIDWELSTIGHPFSDLAYQCMQWRFPNHETMRGLGRRRPQGARHPDRGGVRRQVLRAHGHRRHPASGSSASPSPSSASPPSCRA